jgi:hypothetical protein
MSNLDKKTQVFQRLYGDDSPTQLLHPAAKERRAKETTTVDASPLRERIARALERKTKTNIRETASMSTVNLGSDKLFYGQVQRGQQAVPVNPVQDAPVGPFNHHYVMQRLHQGILDAQDSANFDEAIRLQLLCFKLQDHEISPIQAAREAWLRPLVSTDTAAEVEV